MRIPILVLLAMPVAAQVQDKATAASPTVEFTRDVAPILGACVECHGPSKQRKGLRVDSAAAIHTGGRSGPAVSVSQPEESLLLQHVLAVDGKKPMPPKGPALSAEQVAVLRQWIAAGAKDGANVGGLTGGESAPAAHWAFVPPKQPPLPVLAESSWCKSPLDHFVLASLQSANLQPGPPAERWRWLRRVSLDLIGLPPTPQETAAFVADESSAAFERVVDRLLASPHLGERWARVWLDLARYADTKGYEKDDRRTIWPYRDWVIDAYQRDLPYDQFVLEQMAGDLLPGATVEQQLATAFHRNTMNNDEGGTDDEEFRCAAVVDRVNTTWSALMGTTMACAQCHDHKYDPFSQREYFGLYAFFNQTADADRPDEQPWLNWQTAQNVWQRQQLSNQQVALRSLLQRSGPDEVAAWADPLAQRGVLLELQPGPWHKSAAFTGKKFEEVWQASPAPERGTEYRDWSLLAEDPATLTLPEQTAMYFRSELMLPQASSLIAQLRHDDGVKLWIDGRLWLEHRERTDQPREVLVHLPSGRHEILVKLVNGKGKTGFTLAFRDAVPASAIAVAQKASTARTAEEQLLLRQAYQQCAPELEVLRQADRDLTARIAAVPTVRVPVLRDLAKEQQRVTQLHQRGSHRSLGEVVPPHVPAVFHAWPEDLPRDRLGLARWLVHADNPLFTRVAVNRVWEQLFGVGLVETSEDFGRQGEPPSHPELLDWLACEFRRGGLSHKQLLRTIVLSATYRQDSSASAAAFAQDPQNRLLARGPRVRMSAEMVRDSLLATAGLLVPKIGGPPVMPPQPEGVWEIVYSQDRWQTSAGEDRYRRGIYTFARRTSPYPAFQSFDAPSGEFCVVRRIATNTPLQALVTWNDPVAVEAAQALAARVVGAAATDADRLMVALRSIVSREPRPEEATILSATLARLRREFAAHPERAKAYAGRAASPDVDSAELATWTGLAQILFNLDEFVTKT